MQERSQQGIVIADKLLCSQKLYFADLKPSDIPDDLPGVYAIFNKHTGETLYVGRTQNLRRRLYTNHLHGPKANARLKKYLVEDPELVDVQDMPAAKQYLKEHCFFQYIHEPEMLQRGQVEGLLAFLLNVRYMHEEH